jgi:hypothetical protein
MKKGRVIEWNENKEILGKIGRGENEVRERE